MTNSMLTIGADGVDVEKIMADIQAAVAQKMERGVYRDARIARAERTNLIQLKADDHFLPFYLDCLRAAGTVDISDFEIREKRPVFGSLLIVLKKLIWKLLKFYTYRLWSQQNQVNSMLVTALEGLNDKYRERLQELERRLAALEEKFKKDI